MASRDKIRRFGSLYVAIPTAGSPFHEWVSLLNAPACWKLINDSSPLAGVKPYAHYCVIYGVVAQNVGVNGCCVFERSRTLVQVLGGYYPVPKHPFIPDILDWGRLASRFMLERCNIPHSLQRRVEEGQALLQEPCSV
jgi:hypothetical protein